MKTDRHLILQSTVLAPSEEWTPPAQGWVVARVGEGVGYWLQGGEARELKEGDGFVVFGKPNMAVRASQLGILKLEFYLIQPPLLNGLLTVTEESELEQVANGLRAPIVFFTAADALGQKFSRLVHQSRPESLPSRAALVQFWSQAVSGLMGQPGGEAGGQKLRQRFRQLVGQLPDAELARLSLAQLAGMTACSERHFNRLFRQEFGVSLRTRQIESRLQRARQLLVDTNEKISHIAFETGYRHVGLFNTMFKKHFGLTAGEWRRHNLPAPSIKTSNCPPDNATTADRSDDHREKPKSIKLAQKARWATQSRPLKKF